MRMSNKQMKALGTAHGLERRAAYARQWAEDRAGSTTNVIEGWVRSPDPSGRVEEARFGPHGLTELLTPEGRQYRISHDLEGRVIQAGLTNGPAYHLAYDVHGELESVARDARPLLRFQTFTEPREGVEVEFADGTTERFEFEREALVRAVDGAGGELRLERNSEGGVERLIDPRGNATSYERDPLDPAGVTIVRADGVRETWESDDSELRVSVDGDLIGRVGGDSEHEWAEFPDSHRIEIQWEGEQPRSGESPDGSVEFRYDEDGRLVAERQQKLWIDYAYDDSGNLASIRTLDGQENHFEWDGDGMLRRARDGGREAFDLEYSQAGVLAGIAFPNGVTTRVSLELGPDHDVCTLHSTHPQSDEPLIQACVVLDARGRAVEQSLDAELSRFVYDGAGRLVSVQNEAASDHVQIEWDASGNRVLYRGMRASFDVCNRIESQGSETFAHDVTGRMVSRRGTSPSDYRYDGQGQLREVRSGSQVVASYAYDAFGRRTQKICGERVTNFLWAGRQLLRETTFVGGKQVERRDYLFVPGERQPLAVRIDGELYCYHLDRTGTPLVLTDAHGAVAWRATYDPFGELASEAGPVDQPLRHLGQYADAESGLYYNLFRYYDPRIGRYLTPDPLRLRSGSHNFYNYAEGDPVNRRDPDGHLVFLAALAIVGAAALVGGLIGGAISAATADEGKGWSEFKKGFAWGALAGGIGAAVPIVGAAAGLGAAAVGGASLVADGAVSGIEACSDAGWSTGTFAKAAAISVGTTIATLGLSKIPGVKRALGAAGKRLSSATEKLTDGARNAWRKLRPSPKSGSAASPSRRLTREDAFPHSQLGKKPGRKKSHVDGDGNLCPADPEGDCSIVDHVRGSEPKKSQSPYTSMKGKDTGKKYGDHEISVDRDQLEADIAAGKVEGVEIIDHDQVLAAHDQKIADAQARYDQNPTPKNQERLDYAKMNKQNSMRDQEVLIKGTVPAEYVTVEKIDPS